MTSPRVRHALLGFLLAGAVLLAAPVSAVLAQHGPTLEQAQQHFQAEQWQAAADVAESLARQDATNQQAWLLWGASLRRLAKYEEAAQVYEQLSETGTAPSYVPYLAGLVHAQAGNLNAAFTWLERAVAGGFGTIRQLQTDSAYAALRADARYAALEEKADRITRPCVYSDKHREFDFWIGEWTVYNPQEQLAGTNSIQPAEGHCVLIERWTGSSGSTGMSINYYDPGKDKWVQQWIAPGGGVIFIEGGLDKNGAMVLAGTITTVQGQTSPFRGTWTPLPDGRVRQFFEQSNDGGSSWTPWFDGYYVRQE